jgi:hypothetical protein
MLIGESKLGLIFKVFSLLTLPLCFLTRTFIFKPLLFARKPLTFQFGLTFLFIESQLFLQSPLLAFKPLTLQIGLTLLFGLLTLAFGLTLTRRADHGVIIMATVTVVGIAVAVRPAAFTAFTARSSRMSAAAAGAVSAARSTTTFVGAAVIVTTAAPTATARTRFRHVILHRYGLAGSDGIKE